MRAEWARQAHERALRDSERHTLTERMRTRRIVDWKADVPGTPTFKEFFWQDSYHEVIYGVAGRRDLNDRMNFHLRDAGTEWEDTLGWALGGSWGQFDAGVRHWLEDAAQQLLWTGKACFEVVVGGVLPSTSRVNLVIVPVGTKGRVLSPLGVVQAGMSWSDDHGREFAVTWAQRSRLAVLTLPSSLGGPFTHRAMMWALSTLRLGPPTWVLDEAESSQALLDFGDSQKEETTNLVAGTLTRHWGWDCRFGLSSRIATPYDAERRTRWIASTSQLRDCIIDALTDLVRRLGCPGRVVIEWD